MVDVLGGLDDVGRVFFSFPEVTDPARHRDYNAWHQLDHLPQNRSLAGVRHGERWVRTPRCRAASWVGEGADDFDAAHYVAMYWFANPAEASVKEWFRLGSQTAEVGRRPEVEWTKRRFTGFFRPTGAALGDALVTRGAVPFLPHAGVVIEVGSAESVADPAASAAEPGVLGAWTFAGAGSSDGVAVSLSWCATDPVEVARSRGGGSDGLLLRTALEVITPGEWGWFDE